MVLSLTQVIVLAQDSTNYVHKAGVADIAGEDPGLFIVMMIVMVGFITAITLGLVLISVLFMSVIALVTGGLISFSVISGIYYKSIKTGVKILIISSATVIGGAAGTLGYFIFIFIRHYQFHLHYSFLLSMLGGFAGGLIVGWVVVKLITKLYEKIKPR